MRYSTNISMIEHEFDGYYYSYNKNFTLIEAEALYLIAHGLHKINSAKAIGNQDVVVTITPETCEGNSFPAIVNAMVSTIHLIQVKLINNQNDVTRYSHGINQVTVYPSLEKIEVTVENFMALAAIDTINIFSLAAYRQTVRLHSKYAILLYRIIYLITSPRQMFLLNDLRERLKLDDTMHASYKIYSCFRERVIEQGIREINQKTDKTVKISEIKHSRKVVALCFDVQTKPMPMPA